MITNISLQNMVETVVKKIDFSIYKTEVVVSCEPLPIIKAVPELMEMVLFHLIDNACRYSPDNGKQMVFIQSFKEDKNIVFEVRDNGIGIDNEFTDVVFHIFRRLHTQDAYGGGIGAGLTIVKKIIEAHGGKIWIKSKLHTGTRVMFSLPDKAM